MDERKGHPPRLCSWDYSRPAPYFVTFKVAARERLLGERSRDRLVLSSAGRIVEDCWRGLPDRFPVRLDVHVIMPDHVHAIVHLLEGQDAPRQETSAMPMMARSDIVLGKVVRAWKARSAFEIRRSGMPGFSWQSRYYDRVIRNPAELDRIRRYIVDNPRRLCGGKDPRP